jgi:group I intron endonuclease
MREPVIYWIKNKTNGKFYVGSTLQRYVRWKTHKNKLKANTHHCAHLQAAWNKYGAEVFEFKVVERVADAEHLQEAEDRWLQAHVGKPHCYNHGLRSGAPWRGVTKEAHPRYGAKLTEVQKQALREATLEQWETSDPRTGRKHSDEARQKISTKVQEALTEGRGGSFIPTEETRRKMSEALKGNQNAKGHVRSEEHRRKLSEAQKGNKNFLGKTHSEEAKAKMGQAVRMISPEGEVTVYPRTTAIKEQLGIFLPTVQRSVRSGKPLSKGPYRGWRFEYV